MSIYIPINTIYVLNLNFTLQSVLFLSLVTLSLPVFLVVSLTQTLQPQTFCFVPNIHYSSLEIKLLPLPKAEQQV